MTMLKETFKFQKNALAMCAILLALLITVATYHSSHAAPTFDTNDKIQAEDYKEASKNVRVVNNRGSGKAVGYIKSTASTEYHLEIEKTGKIDVNLRVSSPRGNAYIKIKVDGYHLGTVDVPNTGGWNRFTTVKTQINIPSFLKDDTVDLRLEYHSDYGYNDKSYLLDIDFINLD